MSNSVIEKKIANHLRTHHLIRKREEITSDPQAFTEMGEIGQIQSSTHKHLLNEYISEPLLCSALKIKEDEQETKSKPQGTLRMVERKTIWRKIGGWNDFAEDTTSELGLKKGEVTL